jgi:hypothetical protein
MLRRFFSLIACAGLAVATACNALTDTGNSNATPVAVMVLNARSKGTGYTTSPTANFYRAQNITFSSASAATDTCVAATYNPNAVSSNTATVIGGGAFVLASISGHADSLRKAATTDATYRTTLASGIAFTPGDSISFTIPGDAAGFPGIVATGKTAESFTLDPIVVPPALQPMVLAWSPASDANAAMLFSFRYNDGAGTGLNAQIFCDFRDDGSGTVQAANIARWAGSTQKEVLTQRLRTALIRVPSAVDAYINIVSTFERPTPVSP